MKALCRWTVEPEHWVKVRLLFVRGNADNTQGIAGKHDWAVFLTTDTHLSSAEILELYAMRWAIEVYFKEAKQHLGFLKECSNGTDISFAGKLWQVFRAVITGALDELRAVLGDAVALVMETIDAHIQCLFTQVLQLDPKTLRL